MDEMMIAHNRDYADKRRIDDLKREIDAFVGDPPSRATTGTLVSLSAAVDDLQRDSDQIVRAWA